MSELMKPNGATVEVERPSLPECLVELRIELDRKRTMLPHKAAQGRMTAREVARILAAFETVIDFVERVNAIGERTPQGEAW